MPGRQENVAVGIDARGAAVGAAKFNKSLASMRKQAKAADRAMLNSERRMKSMGSTAQRTAMSMKGLFVGFTALYAIKSVIGIIAEFEDSMQTIKAVTHGTDEQMKAMTKTARELGATTVFSANEAAEGMLFLSRAGFTASQNIEAIPHVLNLAAASATELGEAADWTSNIMKAFGLSTSETQRTVDVLVNTTNSANTDNTARGMVMNRLLS